MKSVKKLFVFITALSVVITMLPATAVAKTRAYKTKTVTVTSGKSKLIKTGKKIKKVKICSKNKDFQVWEQTSKSFLLEKTDHNKTQAVKVTYTNGYTQKYIIKTTLPSYGQKVVDELEKLLADPDEGLKTLVTTMPEGDSMSIWIPDTTAPLGYINKSIKETNMEEIFQNYSNSEKKAFIISIYCQQRMEYNGTKKYQYKYTHNPENNSGFKSLYNGTFKGVCSDGARMIYDICKYLDIKACYVVYQVQKHAWTCIYVKNKAGKNYWMGIAGTSYSYNMKKSLPIKLSSYVNLKKKKIFTKYQYDRWPKLEYYRDDIWN